MACDPATEANTIFTDLMAGEDIDIPDVDIGTITFPVFPDVDYTAPTRLTNDDLTTRKVAGNGTFDALMESFANHIKTEFEKGRITGAEYSKAWVSLTEGAMNTATQFLLGKDAAFWQAIAAQNQAKLAQVQIVTAQVQYETAKVSLALAQFQALTAKSEYALNKMRLASAQVEYCINKFNLDEMLPQQKLMVTAQITGQNLQNTTVIPAQVALVTAQTNEVTTMLPKNVLLIDSQIAKSSAEVLMVDAQRTQITTYEGPKTAAETALLSANKLGTDANTEVAKEQKKLVMEQYESQRAQTMNTRTDGVVVVGAIGKQKDLSDQQIASYKRDSEIKAGRMYLDSWITQKTMDEGLVAPTQFTNANLDVIFSAIKTANGL